MKCIKFVAVFYILSIWLGDSNTTQLSTKKTKFEWLEIDPFSDNTDSLSLKFCIKDFAALFKEFEEMLEYDFNTLRTIPIVCGSEYKENRYVLLGSRWKNKNLSYRILSYPRRSDMLGGFTSIDKEIERAFAVWEEVTDLTFTNAGWCEADINISFLSGEFGEDDYFADTIAHAIPPFYETSGNIHFNEDVEWTIGSSFELDIFETAVHEIAHTLGLGHSQNPDSVMYPYTRESNSRFTLHLDDIEAIQIIYGKKGKPTQVYKNPVIATLDVTEIIRHR